MYQQIQRSRGAVLGSISVLIGDNRGTYPEVFVGSAGGVDVIKVGAANFGCAVGGSASGGAAGGAGNAGTSKSVAMSVKTMVGERWATSLPHAIWRQEN